MFVCEETSSYLTLEVRLNTPLCRSAVAAPFYYTFDRENNRKIRIQLDPNHVRFSFSLSEGTKRRLETEEERLVVCEILMRFREDALLRWPDDPLRVQIDAGVFYLSSHPDPDKDGKVLVTVDRD